MKQSTKFICRSCGYESAKWLGKCPSCSNWNTFDETAIISTTKSSIAKPVPTALTADAAKPKNSMKFATKPTTELKQEMQNLIAYLEEAS